MGGRDQVRLGGEEEEDDERVKRARKYEQEMRELWIKEVSTERLHGYQKMLSSDGRDKRRTSWGERKPETISYFRHLINVELHRRR